MNKKRVAIMTLIILFISAPVVASASAETEYQNVKEQQNVSEAEEVTPDNVAGWFAGTVAGWLAGKVYDQAWDAVSNTNYSGPSHLCVSLPPDTTEEDIKEAFGRK